MSILIVENEDFGNWLQFFCLDKWDLQNDIHLYNFCYERYLDDVVNGRW